MSDEKVLPKQSGFNMLYADAGQSKNGKAEAKAGLVTITDKGKDLTFNGKVFTVKATKENFDSQYGVGIEATAVQADFGYKDVGGVKLGLSGDSEVFMGSEKTSLKALGTGIKADDTGVEFTVLGSGLKLGSWASPYKWFKKN